MKYETNDQEKVEDTNGTIIIKEGKTTDQWSKEKGQKDKRTNNDLQSERHIYIVIENHSAVWKTIKGFIKGTLKMTL